MRVHLSRQACLAHLVIYLYVLLGPACWVGSAEIGKCCAAADKQKTNMITRTNLRRFKNLKLSELYQIFTVLEPHLVTQELTAGPYKQAIEERGCSDAAIICCLTLM